VVGGLQVSTQARAAEDGGLDEVIQLRDERTRRSFAAVVTGVRAAQAVGD
jgi:flagella basal body P-ring formation protein FlgA